MMTLMLVAFNRTLRGMTHLVLLINHGIMVAVLQLLVMMVLVALMMHGQEVMCQLRGLC